MSAFSEIHFVGVTGEEITTELKQHSRDHVAVRVRAPESVAVVCLSLSPAQFRALAIDCDRAAALLEQKAVAA